MTQRVTDEQARDILAVPLEDGEQWNPGFVQDLAADLIDARAEIARKDVPMILFVFALLALAVVAWVLP